MKKHRNYFGFWLVIVLVCANSVLAQTDRAKVKQLFDSGGIEYDNGNYDQAIQTFTQIIKLIPNNTNSKVEYKTLGLAYYDRGLAYARKGDFDAAILDFTQAIKITPNYSDAYRVRGQAYTDSGNFNAAIQDFTQTIKLKPNDADAYAGRGIAYFDAGKLDLAIQDLTQSIKLNPSPAVYRNRAIAYRKQKKLTLAIADETKAAKLEDLAQSAKQTTSWQKFSGDGFTVLMPAKVQQQPFSVYNPETGITGKGINYGAVEKETYFNVGVAPNGFTVAFRASVKTADANAAIMLKEIPGPNGMCARYWKERIECRLDFIKSTQVDDTFLLDFDMFINNKAVGQVRGISTPSRTYQLSVVNLEKYEQSTIDKFFNSIQVTIK